MKTNQIILSLILVIILIIWLCYNKEQFNSTESVNFLDDVKIDYKVKGVTKAFKYNINEKNLYPSYNANINTEIILYEFNDINDSIIIEKTSSQHNNSPETSVGFYILFNNNEEVKTYNDILTLKINSSTRITLSIIHDKKSKTQSITVKEIYDTDTEKQLLKISNLLFTNKDKLNWVVLSTKPDSNNQSNNILKINVNNEHKYTKQLDNLLPIITEIEFSNFIGYFGKILALYTNNELPSNSMICDNYYCYSGYKCFFNLKDLSKSARLELGSDNANKCIVECNKPENLCNIKECQKICLECQDEGELWSQSEKINYCPWYKNIKLLNIDVPSAPKIRGFGGDGKISLEWRRPYDNNSTIINYVLEIKETLSSNNSTVFTIIPNNNCDICEYVINNLKYQTNYDIKLRAINNRGIGYHSNLITVTTQGTNKALLSNIYNDIDGNFDKYKEYECKLGYNNSDHILDNINHDDIDIQKHIKTID